MLIVAEGTQGQLFHIKAPAESRHWNGWLSQGIIAGAVSIVSEQRRLWSFPTFLAIFLFAYSTTIYARELKTCVAQTLKTVMTEQVHHKVGNQIWSASGI